MVEVKSIRTGLPKLDNEIGGGFPKKSSILVLSPIDPEFDLYFSDIIEYSLKDKINCICISLLFPDDLEKFLDFPNFHLICGELGTFSEYKDKKNIELVNTDLEGIVAGFQEIYESIPDNEPIITLIKVSSIQFYHGLAPTATILGMLIELFKKLDISLTIAYLEVDERSTPILESFEEKFDGCIHFLHGAVGESLYKFFYIKKLKGISTPFELVNVSKEVPKTAKNVLKGEMIQKEAPEGEKVKNAVSELKSDVAKTVTKVVNKTTEYDPQKKAVAELKADISKTVDNLIDKSGQVHTAGKAVNELKEEVSKSVDKVMEKTETKPMTQTTATPEVKPLTKPMTQTATTLEVKPLTKPMTQTTATPEVKPLTKPMTQTATTLEVKPLTKPMTQTAATPEVKPLTKPMASKQTAASTSKPKSISDEFSLFKLNDLIDKYWEKIEDTAKEKGIPEKILTDFGWTYSKSAQGKIEIKIEEYGKPNAKEQELSKKVSLIIDAVIKKAMQK